MKKRHYIDEQQLLREVVNAQKTKQPSELLGKMMLELHNHILRHRNFVNYSDDVKSEMRSYSLLRIFSKGLWTFDASKGKSCFNYYTRAVFNNYINSLMRRYHRLSKEMPTCLM